MTAPKPARVLCAERRCTDLINGSGASRTQAR
jgi:hypothetical protein